MRERRERKFGSMVGIAAVMVGLLIPVFAAEPAGAIANGCTPTASGTGAAVPNAEIGEFPAAPLSQSSLRVACTFTSSGASSKFTVHDFNNTAYHQGEARKLAASADAAAGGMTVAVDSTIAIGALINHGISGTGIAPRAFIKSIAGNVLTLNLPHASDVPAGTPLLVDNGSSRMVLDAAVLGGTKTLTSATANFNASDSGKSIISTALSANTTMTFVNATTVTLSATAAPLATVTAASNGVNVMSFTGSGTLNLNATSSIANSIAGGTGNVRVKTSAVGNAVLHYTGFTATTLTGVSRVSGAGLLATTNAVNLEKDVATLRGVDLTTTARSVTDATTTCTATTIKSAAAGFGPDDIGMNISGAGIGANAVVTAVATATNTATIAGGVTTTPCPGKGGTFFNVGTPSVTAPKDNDTVLQIGIQTDINPVVIPGVNRCAAGQIEGFGLAGVWANPGSFTTSAFSAAPPGNFAAIGQIQFKTSALTYSAYLVQRPSGDAAKAGGHYDIVFPSIPVGLGTCPNSPAGISFSFTVLAVPTSQAMLPVGVGRPLTTQLRAIGPVASGSMATTAIMKSDDPARPFTIPSTCTLLATPAADFHCGNG